MQPSTQVMSNSELSERNFKRIHAVNWLISLPLLLLFAWPYHFACSLLHIDPVVSGIGSLVFAAPFMITILHGHVTMALGQPHRHHYYKWLSSHPLSYGLLFHEIMPRTRFRIILLIVSMTLMLTGYLIQYPV